tara:strand:+ start:147 stop:482 length:336 start_codon:yes stop_codon:yes gene_type:complete
MKTELIHMEDSVVKDAIQFISYVRPNLAEGIKSVEDYNSGGGFIHLFLQLKDDRIFSFHHMENPKSLRCWISEISFKSYKSIDDYIIDEDGFGHEPDKDNYDNRYWSMTDE